MTLPDALDTGALLRPAVDEAKVAFFPDRSGANMLRLSFSLNDPARTEQGIARLAQIVSAALSQ